MQFIKLNLPMNNVDHIHLIHLNKDKIETLSINDNRSSLTDNKRFSVMINSQYRITENLTFNEAKAELERLIKELK